MLYVLLIPDNELSSRVDVNNFFISKFERINLEIILLRIIFDKSNVRYKSCKAFPANEVTTDRRCYKAYRGANQAQVLEKHML